MLYLCVQGASQLERVYELIDKQHAAFLARYPEADKQWHELLDAGPVGETPLHLCFLLGLKEVGKALQKRHYNTPELLSVPYENDLRVWRQTSVLSTDEDDGGLYTGQTVLHIAVAQEDIDLCKWLLDR